MEPRVGMMFASGIFRKGEGLELYANRAEETFQLEYHAHDFHEIACVSEGRGYHHIGGRVVPVAKGDVFLLPIGLPHVFRPASAGGGQRLVVYNCVFTEALLREAAKYVPELDLSKLFEKEGTYARDARLSLEPLFQSLVAEHAKKTAGSSGMMFALFLQLLVQFSRLSAAGLPALPETSVAEDPIEAAAEYIRQHAPEPLTLRMLAHRCGMSERHFFRLFKARTGQPFLAYLQHARIRIGCELLLGTRHKIGTVAEMVGYRDTQSFHQTFKRIVGLTPGEYRKSEANRLASTAPSPK